jgi:prepilin-type N-terminal cleavage/methylation domain-containing protein
MKKQGFTLLEILVVIIIIGILASLALPQYMKTTKKARTSEAVSNIGSIRGAEIRYYQEYDVLVTGSDLSGLDIEDPNVPTYRYFDYSVSGGSDNSPATMVITATGRQNKVTQNIVVSYDASTGRITTTGLE